MLDRVVTKWVYVEYCCCDTILRRTNALQFRKKIYTDKTLIMPAFRTLHFTRCVPSLRANLGPST
jgi:hypothetical protein